MWWRPCAATWQVLAEERQSALNVTASTYRGSAPESYVHVQDRGEYWQVDRVHSPSHVETLARTASREDAYLHVDKAVPVFENGGYVTGGRLHHVASAEEFYDQGRGKWVRLAGGFRVVEGRGRAEFPEDPTNYEDGIRDAHLHYNAAYDYRTDEGFGSQSHGYQNGYYRTMDALSKQADYAPDPDAGWRYHYPDPPQEAGHGGAPTASPIPAGAQVGPDGFPPDYGVGEQRTPEAYAYQTTPSAWTVTPGTEWRDSYLPNAATGLAQGQYPAPGNPAQASRRTASAWDPTDTHVPGHRPFPYNYTDAENEAYDIGVDRAGQGEPLVNIHGVPGTGIEAFSPEHHMYTRGWQGERREHARPHPDMERRDFTPITSSRRTAGSESGTSDDFNGSDKPYWKCSLCGENNYSHGDKCNGCGKATKSKVVDWLDERTGKRASRHTADRQDDRAQAFHEWAKENGHNPDDLGTLKLYEKQPGISRAHADEIADIYHGEDTDWRATHKMQQQGSRRTAQEGIAPSGPGPNPNYFSQGTNGLAGPPTFPEDPGPEPYTNTLINDFYGTVPPQESTGSEQGTQDGAGYSRMGRRRPGFRQSAGERTAASGLDQADEIDPDPADPYEDEYADRRHDMGRMAADVPGAWTYVDGKLTPPEGVDPEEHARTWNKGLADWQEAERQVAQRPNRAGPGYSRDQDSRTQPHHGGTNGQIVGHCDNCNKPVRWHDGKGSHLEHLHNSSHKCNDGGDARTSSLQFFDPTWVAKLASDPLAIAPANAPPLPPTNAPQTGTTPPNNPMPTPAAPMPDSSTDGSNAAQQPGNGISSVSSTFAAYPPHFQTTSLQTITAPTAENPTGRSEDEYKANTWEGLINQRPMQSAEDRHINTPVKPQDHLRTRNINTPTPGLDDEEEDSARSQDEDEEED